MDIAHILHTRWQDAPLGMDVQLAEDQLLEASCMNDAAYFEFRAIQKALKNKKIVIPAGLQKRLQDAMQHLENDAYIRGWEDCEKENERRAHETEH